MKQSYSHGESWYFLGDRIGLRYRTTLIPVNENKDQGVRTSHAISLYFGL